MTTTCSCGGAASTKTRLSVPSMIVDNAVPSISSSAGHSNSLPSSTSCAVSISCSVMVNLDAWHQSVSARRLYKPSTSAPCGTNNSSSAAPCRTTSTADIAPNRLFHVSSAERHEFKQLLAPTISLGTIRYPDLG